MKAVSSIHPKDARLPTVQAVIVNWNGKEHLLECLASIEALDYPQQVKDRCCRQWIAGRLTADSNPAASTVCASGERKNLGMRTPSTGEFSTVWRLVRYIWISNNDVVVFPDTLRELVNAGRATNPSESSRQWFTHTEIRRK